MEKHKKFKYFSKKNWCMNEKIASNKIKSGVKIDALD